MQFYLLAILAWSILKDFGPGRIRTGTGMSSRSSFVGEDPPTDISLSLSESDTSDIAEWLKFKTNNQILSNFKVEKISERYETNFVLETDDLEDPKNSMKVIKT